MTAAQIQAVLDNVKNPRFVATHGDYRTGQWMYWHGFARFDCTSTTMAAGWDYAEAEDNKGCKAYITAMYQAGEPGAAVDAVLDAHFAGFRHK